MERAPHAWHDGRLEGGQSFRVPQRACVGELHVLDERFAQDSTLAKLANSPIELCSMRLGTRKAGSIGRGRARHRCVRRWGWAKIDHVECLSDEVMAAWADGLLENEERQQVASHLETCLNCKDLASELAHAGRDHHTGLLGGRYRLDCFIAEGASGTVWAARDTQQGRNVAVKILRQSTTESRARLMRELDAGRSVDHPSVLKALDLVVEREEIGLVFDLLEGLTLRDKLAAHGPLSPLDALALIATLADGLAAIHRVGVVHRDIKPANIFIQSSGAATIIDLGLAKITYEAPTAISSNIRAFKTRPGAAVGTPLYMAPEQLRHATSGRPCDIWSLGVVAHECMTGRRPYDAATPASLLSAIMRLHDSTLDGLSHLDPKLSGLVTAMLQIDASARPTAESIASASRLLLRALRGTS